MTSIDPGSKSHEVFFKKAPRKKDWGSVLAVTLTNAQGRLHPRRRPRWSSIFWWLSGDTTDPATSLLEGIPSGLGKRGGANTRATSYPPQNPQSTDASRSVRRPVGGGSFRIADWNWTPVSKEREQRAGILRERWQGLHRGSGARRSSAKPRHGLDVFPRHSPRGIPQPSPTRHAKCRGRE